MRPISVRFQCFGPYMEEQYIDFSRLEQDGLFLICGETGAGKTAILDAMCYALYGKSSGGLRGDMEAMRCKSAGKDDETRVEFVFDARGKRYKFTRALRYGRKNLIDEHNCMVLEGGAYIPFYANPKKTNVNQKAEDLLGLTYDQFCQVVILPQGQFERFLVSDSAEKEAILVKLSRADRWQRIADELYRRVAEQDKKLDVELSTINAKLSGHGCAFPDELAEKVRGTKSRLDALSEALEQAKKVKENAQSAYEGALMVDREFSELDSRQSKCDDLLKKALDAEAEEEALRRADRADGIAPAYAAHQSARVAKRDAEQAAERDGRVAQEAHEALENCGKRMSAHDAVSASQEKAREKIPLLENARRYYEALAEKARVLKKAEDHAVHWEEELECATALFEKTDRAWLDAMEAQSNAMSAYSAAQLAYLSNISGILACELRQGIPCPVCGSTEHPSPAAVGKEYVSAEELDGLQQAMGKAGEAVKAASKQRQDAEQKKTAAAAAHADAVRAAAVAKSECDGLAAQKVAGIDTAGQLEERIDALKRSVADYEIAGKKLREELNAAATGKGIADSNLERSQVALKAATEGELKQAEAWQSARASSGFESDAQYTFACIGAEEKERRKAAVATFRETVNSARSLLEEQREKLQGKQRPDMKVLQKSRNEAEEIERSTLMEHMRTADALKQMETDLTDAVRRRQAYDVQRIQVDENLAYANRLRGRSGLSLQRYVLSVMLTSIVGAANQLLKTVHSGRYQLFRTDGIAGSGHKSGLELEVLDGQSQERRSVTTLSGGEKFLVALSLAIGLSNVVQAQGAGMRLEAMFIDEGFGSLDQRSVGDALEVLSSVQRANGLVGIISHVERLKETIASQIEIIKGKNGSRCVMR